MTDTKRPAPVLPMGNVGTGREMRERDTDSAATG